MPGSVPAPPETDGSTTEESGILQPTSKLKYLQRPPTIVPNYGRKKQSLLPKSNISRVLLYDNVMQQQMLDVKLNNLKLEKKRTGKILDLHKKSFLLRQSHKPHMLQRTAGRTQPALPDISKRHHSHSPELRLAKPNPSTKRSLSLPSGVVDLTDNANDLHVEPNTSLVNEIETVERANDITLPEINGLHLPQIERTQSGGITKSLVIQTKTGENCDTVELVNGLEPRQDPEKDTDLLPVLDIDENALVTNRRQASLLSVKDTHSSVVDARFLSLQNTLQQVDHHTEGFAELSPSFKRHYAKIPEYLISM